MDKKVIDAIKVNINKMDQHISEIRGQDPIHFHFQLKVPESQSESFKKQQGKIGVVAKQISAQLLRCGEHIPPEFIHLHEQIFPEGLPVENIDPEKKLNWWDDISIIEDFNSIPNEVSEKVEWQINEWKKNEALAKKQKKET
jgi:hypothetical protein